MNIHQKKCIYIKRDEYTSKEMYIYQKRCIYIKRNVYISKEMNIHQKKCIYVKRDVYTSKKKMKRYADIFALNKYEKRPIYT